MEIYWKIGHRRGRGEPHSGHYLFAAHRRTATLKWLRVVCKLIRSDSLARALIELEL